MEKIIIFASGTKDNGGSGFQALLEATHSGILKAEIIAVVSNHKDGGVKKRAKKLGVPFVYFSGPFEASEYRSIVRNHDAPWVALSGWLKIVRGLDPARTINIHPGPLPRFGGKGMYGHYVHEAVIDAFKKDEIKQTEVSMHFVTEKYDEGPLFFKYPILIRENDTAQTLATRVNAAEHCFQPWITNLVVHRQIRWDGKNPETLRVPPWFPFF